MASRIGRTRIASSYAHFPAGTNNGIRDPMYQLATISLCHPIDFISIQMAASSPTVRFICANNLDAFDVAKVFFFYNVALQFFKEHFISILSMIFIVCFTIDYCLIDSFIVVLVTCKNWS